MRRAVSGAVILLAALGFTVAPAYAQNPTGEGPEGRESAIQLEQNYPNPFNPTTRIPFVLGEQIFDDGGPVVVTIRIYNVLQQLVAVPTALNHPEGNGVPVDGLVYETSGRKEAYWNGLDRSGRQVASGVYYVQLAVNGETRLRKMVVTK